MAIDIPDPDEREGAQGGGETPLSEDAQAFFQAKYNEAFAALRGTTQEQRLNTLRFLRSKGYYSGSEVSPDGLGQNDISRYSQFLVYAYVSNLTTQKALETLNKWETVSTGGASRQKTPQADVDSVFNQVMQQRLGRSARADELERFRNAYSRMESGMNPPSVSSAAEQQVETGNTEEAVASRFASVAGMFEQMLRGA